MFGNLRRADDDRVNGSGWGDPWKVARASDQGGQDSVKRRHSRSRLPIGGRLLMVGAVTLATVVATMSVASASSDTNWQLADGSVSKAADGSSTFDFTAANKAHLLYSNKQGEAISATTMSANFTVSGVSPAATFTYNEPTCGSTPATVRLLFETGGKFAYTNYWWADVTPGSAALANGAGTLSALVDSAQAWSDWNGQPSNANAAAFDAAAANATVVGLSFGGGCFFENGVGTSDGSGSLTLNSFTG